MKLFVRFLQVMKRDVDAPESEWRNWSWTSDGDLMLNGSGVEKVPEASVQCQTSRLTSYFSTTQ
jgi:hypothetical protein